MTSSLGPYEIRGELGRGAMAIVWRAFDTRLEREVAIKEPSLPPNADPGLASEFLDRFVREGKAAAGLNHAGIVTIYNADVYDGRPAIVMELIEGETLGAILSRGALSPATAYAILDQLLDAVGYAHSRGIVHRDIKPDNVFVTGDGRVKLTDFGIAHMGSSSTLTQAGTVMGTPGYMAPEQVTGVPADARADIFAVGVIAHEMLTGQNPFGSTEGVQPTTVMYRIVHENPPALPAELLDGQPCDINMVLSAALAKDPDHRFVDANSFRAALRGQAIPFPGSTTAGGTFSPAKQRSGSGRSAGWWPYAVAGVLGVAIIGVLLAMATGSPPATAPGNPSSPAPTPPVESPPPVIPPEEEAGNVEAPPEPAGPDLAAIEQDIRTMIEEWRVSRESLAFSTYMGFYSPDFMSAKGESYSTWSSDKQRIYSTTDPPTITFHAVNVTVASDGTTARASVDQTYNSNNINTTMTKVLDLRQESGSWKIVSENS